MGWSKPDKHDFYYPPLGFGENSNSVASTLITVMGFTETPLPGVPFYRVVPGDGALLLNAQEIVFLQQKWNILPSVPGSLRALDFQSAVNNPDGSVTIFTTYQDGTNSISHYRQNAFEETLYGPDGGSLGSVSASSSNADRVSVQINGQVNTVNWDNANVTLLPNAQATIIGSGVHLVALPNSTVQTTTVDATIATAAGGQLSVLGSNNNLILGTGTTVDMLGNNNTIIGPVAPGSVVDQGTGNQFVSAQNLPSDVSVRVRNNRGFEATFNDTDVVSIVNGGLDGGIADGIPFDPGPDPNWGDEDEEEGEGADPDPLINGHSFIIPGDLEIVAASGDNSIQGGLNKNVIVTGDGNNVVEAYGTENTVVTGGGNNTVSVSGQNSTVSLGGGLNYVRSLGQHDTILGGAGNVGVQFGPGNHTIMAGTGAARTDWDPLLDPGIGMSFANIIRADLISSFGNPGGLPAQLDGPYQNRIIGGPHSNYLEGGWGDNTITGGDSADRLIGGRATPSFGGQSVIHGGGGDDSISGGIGGETIIYGDAGHDTIDGGHSKSTIYGGDGNDSIRAAIGYDSVLYGEAGDDRLEVGITAGNVTLDGGSGDDQLIGSPSSFLQTFVFGRDYGQDSIEGVTGRGVLSLTPGVLPEDLTFQTNGSGDLLVSINGTSDRMTIGHFFAGGTWTIAFSDGTTWNRNEVVNRTPGLVLTDLVGGQHVLGSPLADTLSGAGGNSLLEGGQGSDTYLIELGTGVTTIEEYPDGQSNTLVFGPGIEPDSVTISRDASQGTMRVAYGTQGDVVEVNHFDPYTPVESLGIQAIQFADGTTWDITAILDRTPGLVLTDTVGGQTLEGSPLADTLSGPGGNTTLSGGEGNDVYLFDRGYGRTTIFDQDLSGTALNTIQLGATITPTDVTVQLSADGALLLNLAGSVDQLVIQNYRERSFQAFEVSFADGTVWDRGAIIGQLANFPLVADPGGSALTGTVESETLIGLGGDDVLDGLGGDDLLAGGGGDDLYYVYSPGDQIVEQPDQGHDRVRSYIDYTLPEHVEDLQLSLDGFSGPSPIVGIGNAEDNEIRGNFQNNVLQGGAGHDTLWGGYGDESFGPGNDELSGGPGNDTYYVDALTGNGVDTIHDTALPGEGNRLQMGPSIRPGDLTFVQSPGSLFVGVGTGGDGVVLEDFDPTNTAGSLVVDTITFTGGIQQRAGGISVSLTDFLKPAIMGTDGHEALNGTGTVDVIKAGDGDDVITGQQGNDVLIGGAGQDTYVFNLGDGADLIDDVVQLGEANRILFGPGITAGMLSVEYGGTANQGNMTLHVGSEGDALHFVGFLPDDPSGAHAIETLQFDDGTTMSWAQLLTQTVTIRGTAGDDGELFGTFANDRIMGFAGKESISGGTGDDRIDGGVGNDFLAGGSGADAYVYNLGDGHDVIDDDAEQVFDAEGNPSYVNNRIDFGDGVTLTDLDVSIMQTPSFNQNLFIGVGSDGDGLDLGRVADSQLGIRTIHFTDGLSLNLPDLVRAVLLTDGDQVKTGGEGSGTVLGGNGNDLLTGGNGSSVLIGWKGDDILTGGSGSTRYYGGAGNDLLQGRADEDDIYVFNRGDGIDTIQDRAQVEAGNRIQFGAGITQGDLTFTQDHAAKRLIIQVGSSGFDVIRLENFALTGVDGSVVAQTLAFADGSTVQLADLLATPGVIAGTAGNDFFVGTTGNDTFTGGAGNDLLSGGPGDDTYIFNVGDGIDTIADTATAGEGNTLQFGAGIASEDLTLGLGSLLIRVGTTGDAIHLATFNPNDVLGPRSIEQFTFADGTTLSYDQLVARGFDLNGTAGNDVMNGTNVNDRILGFAGDDSLVGGQGEDTLVGGAGNDTYSVDSVADVVTEQVNEGNDRVLSSVNYTLGPNVENLTLAGGSAINGTGNELTNVLVGNNGSNILDGGLGADQMIGGLGNDTYVVDTLDDVVMENVNEGTDTVQTSLSYTLAENVENVRLTGSADVNGTGNSLNNVLVGNSGNNVLVGEAGDDRLHGASGADILRGGSGDDTYRFDVGDGIDTIEDTATVNEGNRILFGEGITLNNLTLIQDQAARTVTIQVGSSGNDKLVLNAFDSTGATGSLVAETVTFADGSAANLLDLLATPVNHAPTVVTPLADQQATRGILFSWTVPAGTFADEDLSDQLTYDATLATGEALPTWLTFDPATQSFNGTPEESDVGGHRCSSHGHRSGQPEYCRCLFVDRPLAERHCGR